MPFTVEVYASHNLTVAHCSGLVREAEIHDAIAFSFAYVPLLVGMDRVVCIDGTADLRELDADALHRIQSHILEAGNASDLPAFRSVLITSSPFHQPIAELYKAIWDGHQLPGVEFSVVATTAEALTILGLPAQSELLVRRSVVPRAKRD